MYSIWGGIDLSKYRYVIKKDVTSLTGKGFLLGFWYYSKSSGSVSVTIDNTTTLDFGTRGISSSYYETFAGLIVGITETKYIVNTGFDIKSVNFDDYRTMITPIPYRSNIQFSKSVNCCLLEYIG